jgi:hypothetical protein
MCLISNLTIETDFSSELDKKMTSVDGRRSAPTPTPFISNTRLILFDCSLACVPHLGVVDKTRH